jgi:uncharacterized protein
MESEFINAEKEYNKAHSSEKKAIALENMLSNTPINKKSEKLREKIKSELTKVKKEAETEGKRLNYKKSKIKKRGAATVVLIGPPNSGKSLLLNKLTGKKIEIENRPLTTTSPKEGIMDYKGVKLQIIELPAINHGYFLEEKGASYLSILSNSDLAVIVTDKPEISGLFKEFEDAGLRLNQDDDKDAKNIDAFIVISKADLKSFDETYMELCRYSNFDLMPLSAMHDNLKMFSERLWKHLKLIKIYLKIHGKGPKRNKLICLEKGSKIGNLLERLPIMYNRKFSFAKVWGRSAKTPGMRFGHDHILEDDDTVEIHI